MKRRVTHATHPASKAVLIHSAAGGVGSNLVQMCKLLGLGPVVAVVGTGQGISTHLSISMKF